MKRALESNAVSLSSAHVQTRPFVFQTRADEINDVSPSPYSQNLSIPPSHNLSSTLPSSESIPFQSFSHPPATDSSSLVIKFPTKLFNAKFPQTKEDNSLPFSSHSPPKLSFHSHVTVPSPSSSTSNVNPALAIKIPRTLVTNYVTENGKRKKGEKKERRYSFVSLDLVTGDLISVRWDDGKWYKGVIKEVKPLSFVIMYDDETDPGPHEHLYNEVDFTDTFAIPSKGQRIAVKSSSGKWMSGRVLKTGRTFSIMYDRVEDAPRLHRINEVEWKFLSSCSHCGKGGHYRPTCPELSTSKSLPISPPFPRPFSPVQQGSLSKSALPPTPPDSLSLSSSSSSSDESEDPSLDENGLNAYERERREKITKNKLMLQQLSLGTPLPDNRKVSLLSLFLFLALLFHTILVLSLLRLSSS